MLSDGGVLHPPDENACAGNTLWVLGVALVARLAVATYAVLQFPAAWFYSRGQEMGLLADALVRGAGLSSPFGPQTGPTAMIAPGYPLFVAGVFRLLGSYSRAAELTLIGTNLLLNVLTVWLILRLGRRIAGERAALATAAFWACSLPLLWMPTIFWETSISTFLLLSFVEIAMWLRDHRSDLSWTLAGVYCALAGLLNPALLPSLLALSAWALSAGRGRGRSRRGALALFTFAFVFSPWPIRNARVFHAWIPTRTTIGFELWMGNHPGATGFLDESLFPTYSRPELAAYKESGELIYTNNKSKLAWEYIQAHRATFLHLTVIRAMRFWAGSGNREGSGFYILHALLTTLLGAVGAVYLLRSSNHDNRTLAIALLLPLAVFPLPYYVTHAEFRYRLVVDPLLVVLSAKALQQALAGGSRFSKSRTDL